MEAIAPSYDFLLSMCICKRLTPAPLFVRVDLRGSDVWTGGAFTAVTSLVGGTDGGISTSGSGGSLVWPCGSLV